jgi:hydroxylamine dehydrogenase
MKSNLLWIGLLAAVVIVWVLTTVIVTPHSGEQAVRSSRVRTASLTGECVECHTRSSPGIVNQHGLSAHAAAGVTCSDCHAVGEDHFAAMDHYETTITGSPTSAQCEACHQAEVAQFERSRHGLPAHVAMVGTEGLTEEQLALYNRIEEITAVDSARNSLYHLEGPEIARFACHGCHDIGRPNPDGSVGNCTDCHLRHEFSLEQARHPETCGACHIGPDHPQWEIYQESPHGIAYLIHGDDWNWDADPGTLTSQDIPAATCATCHMSGFGTQGTTHDVGERLTWFLFQQISQRRPGWEENGERMRQVCRECHSTDFVADFYTDADALVDSVNELCVEGQAIYTELSGEGLLTPEPFDQPIDFVNFDLWHHWGRTAKFGAWMQGPDYTQWHGAYELLRELAELRERAEDLREEAGVEAAHAAAVIEGEE